VYSDAAFDIHYVDGDGKEIALQKCCREISIHSHRAVEDRACRGRDSIVEDAGSVPAERQAETASLQAVIH
jgi:hypothetical protein